MGKLLAIDIGNTKIVIGLWDGETLVSHWCISTQHHRTADEYAVLILSLFSQTPYSPREIEGVVISSVVPPLTSTFEEISQRYFQLTPLVVRAGVKTGVRIRYDNPREVGADRVANAAAAFRLYGGPACVVDFSTATIFDAISREGDYLGGAIAPGIAIAAEALFLHTAKLPRVELERPPKAIGTNTTHSIQSGLIFGYAGLVEGMVARFREELGPDMKVIATGAFANLIARETKAIQIVDPWLTLKGLRIIYELNRK
jgi:type III pantothenate kinase